MKDNIKVIIYFSFFVIFMILAYIGYNKFFKMKIGIEENQTVIEKIKLKDFEIFLENGDKISSKQLLVGKPIVINVWTSWCGYCDIEMKYFNELYLKEKDNVVFVMLNATGDRDSKEKAKEYVKSKGYEFQIYYDLNLEALDSLDIYSYPTTIFIDKDGYVDSKIIGSITKEVLESKINSLK